MDLAMGESRVGFRSKGLDLEGVMATPEEVAPPYPGAVVCHPHPLLGGDMDNAVVTALCRWLGRAGFVTLRFNFRGVGESNGVFSNGQEEQEDVRAALDVVRKWPGVGKEGLAVLGYSFGASVVSKGLAKLKGAGAFVLVAPPVSAVKGASLRHDRRPKLLLAGERDKIAPPDQLEEALGDGVQLVEFLVIPRADHGFIGHEAEVAERAAEFVQKSLRHR